MKFLIEWEYDPWIGEFDLFLIVPNEETQESYSCLIDGYDFFSWLSKTDRLNWEINWPDHTGTHIQKTGSYQTINEYLDETPSKTVGEDLYLFAMGNRRKTKIQKK